MQKMRMAVLNLIVLQACFVWILHVDLVYSFLFFFTAVRLRFSVLGGSVLVHEYLGTSTRVPGNPWNPFC